MSLKAIRYDGLIYFCNRVVANFPCARVRHFFYRSVMRIDIAPGAWLLSGIWFDPLESSGPSCGIANVY